MIINPKIEIDITIRKFKPKDVTLEAGKEPEYILSEENTFKDIGIKSALYKLLDLFPYNL